MNKSGSLIVISGPSGVGKGTIIPYVLKKVKRLKVSISATTRKPRNTEVDGVNYYFISKEKFNSMIENDEFYEYVNVLDNSYGTPKKQVDDLLAKGYDVILEIETIGAEKIMNEYKCVSIFISPPSFSELKNRLINRGTETQEQIELRMKKSEKEMNSVYSYDYVVINDDIEDCAEKIACIIRAERLKVKSSKAFINKIINS
ncbi:MAG: guanylate kinase [Clostridia bacterium]|nr:guanylate kinase [Clostridia bacterium]